MGIVRFDDGSAPFFTVSYRAQIVEIGAHSVLAGDCLQKLPACEIAQASLLSRDRGDGSTRLATSRALFAMLPCLRMLEVWGQSSLRHV